MYWKLVVAAVAAVAVIVAAVTLPLATWVAWLRGAGALGVTVYAIAFLACGLVMLPTVELFAVAGALYGVWWGSVLCTVLTLVATAIAFPIGRSGRRRWIEARLDKHPRLRAIDRQLGERAFWIALLLRISPIVPFAPLNYAFATTRMSLRTNLVTTFLGMLPMTILLVWSGAVVDRVAETRSRPWHVGALGIGIAVTVAATVLVTRAIRRAVAAVPSADGRPAGGARSHAPSRS